MGQPSIRFPSLASGLRGADACHLLLIFYMTAAVPTAGVGTVYIINYWSCFSCSLFGDGAAALSLFSGVLDEKLRPCLGCPTFSILLRSNGRAFFQMETDLEKDMNICRREGCGAP